MKHNYFKHLLIVLLLLCSTVVSAQDFEVDGIYYNITDDVNKTVEVTFKGEYDYSYSDEYTGCVVIPERVIYSGTTYSITSIGDDAFSRCDELTSIEIPRSITSIGIGAFGGCEGLTSIEIPRSITSIGFNAFGGCNSVSKIVVEEENSTYDSRENCNAIIHTESNTLIHGCYNTTIPNSITTIGHWAFSGLKITTITIPEGVTTIAEGAFDNCINLTSIEIPASVTSIYYNALNHCKSLKHLFVAEGNPVYDSRDNCNAIIHTESNKLIIACNYSTIPDNVTVIGICSFGNCTTITGIAIPDGVTSIEDRAFHFCTSLTSVTIPNSVTTIETNAFRHCTGLTSVTVESETPPTIYSNTFSEVTATLYVPYGTKAAYETADGWSSFANIVEMAPTKITFTVNQYGCGTYCSPYALDFSEVEGLKAYSAIGFNSNTQVVTLARVKTTAAGTGIFIKGEPGEYKVPVIEECNEHTLNLLVGTLESTIVNSTADGQSNFKFTIAEGDEAPMFYPFEDNTTFSANRAYLQIPTAWLPANAQNAISARFEDGETTDIDELKGESGEVKTIYDLQGRVVENPTSGIYIINGKKVVIK